MGEEGVEYGGSRGAEREWSTAVAEVRREREREGAWVCAYPRETSTPSGSRVESRLARPLCAYMTSRLPSAALKSACSTSVRTPASSFWHMDAKLSGKTREREASERVSQCLSALVRWAVCVLTR